jgi:hypothetical protein
LPGFGHDGDASKGAAKNRYAPATGAGRHRLPDLETLQAEAIWKEKLSRSPEKLRRLAEEAEREHRQGETHPLDDLL